MFRLCLKRFFTSLKYVFSVLGVLFLALLIGASVMISGFTKSVNTMVDEIKTTTQDADLSFDRIKDAIVYSFTGEEPEEKVKILENGKTKVWMEETIEDAVSGVVENYAEYGASVATSIGNCVMGILSAIGLFMLAQILGIMCGRGLTNYFCRYEIEHRNVFKIFVARLLHNITITLSVILVIFCLINVPYLGLALVILYPVIYCILALISAYTTAGKDRPLFKKVLSVRNVGALLASSVVMLLITGVFAALIFWISNVIIALYVNAAILIVVSVVVGLNADAIVAEVKN